MAFKRSISPGRHSLLADVLRLIAEPVSTNHKKKPEVYCFQSSSKVTNHDYCDVCLGGGEIVCCDKCPKSYHIKCHSPSMNKLPDGEWLCKECSFIENNEINSKISIDDGIDIKTFLKRQFEALNSYYVSGEEFLSEIPIQRKYNVKLAPRKQLDKMKMVRKVDRCFVCKRGILRGRLMQCSYCLKLYHLNCLDPPIRDWDHSMKFQCPIHTKFFELVYPDIFTPDCGVRSDAITMKRQRCELTSQPVNTFFNVPSNIDALYKKPEDNIPTTNEKSSLNILCDVASIALESINSNLSTHSDINVSNDISEKFLARRLNKSQKNKCLLHERPTASLSFLSIPINISTVYKSSFTIGKHRNNDLCLLPYGNCEYISDYHAVITFDSKLGDFLVKNRSRYGIIVDNVSYFGNRRPKEVSNSELKEINSQVKKHINKRRRIIQNRRMLRIYHQYESEKVIIKYAGKKRKFDYRLMSKYYSNKFKNVKHSYRKIQCKCSKRVIPKDGYAGYAVLRNKSIMSIGCMRFKFTYSTEEITKVCSEKVHKVHAKKVSKACVEIPKACVDVPNVFVKEDSKVCMGKIPNVCTEEVLEEGKDEVPNGYVEEVPEVYIEEDSSGYTEENLAAVLAKQDKALSTSEQQSQSGTHRNCLFEITTTFSSLINRCESLEEQHVLKQMYLDSISEFEFSDSHLEINDDDDNNVQSLNKDVNCERTLENDGNMTLDDVGNQTLINDGDLALNDDVDPTLNDGGDPTLNDVHISGSTDTVESHERIPVSGVQSRYVNDLIQEVDESFSDGGEIVEEEVLFEFGYNNTEERVVGNVQNWIEEVDVEVVENSVDQQPQLRANYNARGDYKTEHLYCARSPTDPIPTIIISSDDDDDDDDGE